MSYEIHITVRIPVDKVEDALYEKIAGNLGWKTSKIDGDPLLGTGSRFYFTAHKKTENEAFIKMNDLSDILRDNRIKIIREKIEHIIYDTKNLPKLMPIQSNEI